MSIGGGMRVGIIGGGLMGMAAGHRLASAGHRVTILERADQPGGLATWSDFGPFCWDRFYHVILPSDAALIEFVRRIGLASELRWSATQTGYYVDGRCHSLSTNVDFLRFPLLSLWAKARLAATIVYCSRIDDWRRLEKVGVEEFLVRTSGRRVFESFWKPLLLAKLGENYRRVSAVFIWSYIKRLFSARDATAQREHLGHVRGGYKRVLEVLEERLSAAGGELRLGTTVTRIEAAGPRGIRVTADATTEEYEKVIFTSPVNVLRGVVGPELVSVVPGKADVEYLGVACVVLVTRRPLVPYYVLNIADERVPFTGIIGMSNVVDTAETGGLHVTYLPRYVLSTDGFLRRSDAEIREEFLRGVRLMFPQFEERDIVSVHVHRALKVQPLQVIGYSSLVPSPTTHHPDFYVLNTSQFVNNTLNNNEVIRAVNAFFEQHGRQFGPGVAQIGAPSRPVSRAA